LWMAMYSSSRMSSAAKASAARTSSRTICG
jgi:hypothetical protein